MNRKHLSLTTQILISLLAGVLCGLFFGEMTAPLQIIGEAFVRLMQMTVLPFVMVSIIASLGGLNKKDVKTVAAKIFSLLGLFWLVGIGVTFLMQAAFPALAPRAIYSTAKPLSAEPVDILEVFIASNLFSSLSKGMFPAVVMFCILVGVALINIEKKGPFLEQLEVLAEALGNVNRFLVRLSPIGLFARTAYSVGVMSSQQFVQLQVFFIALLVLVALLLFSVLPAMISWFAPFRYGDILSACSGAVLLAFATQEPLVSFPLIEDGVRQLFNKHGITREAVVSCTAVAVPFAFNFPTLSAFHQFLFVFFTSWMYKFPLGLIEQVRLALIGLPTFIAPPEIALPFVLRNLHLPDDAADLYSASQNFHDRFIAALCVMYLFAFAVMFTAWTLNLRRPNKKHALSSTLAGAVFLIMAIVSMRVVFNSMLERSYQGAQTLANRRMPVMVGGEEGFYTHYDIRVYRSQAEVPPRLTLTGDLLTRIRIEDRLRVGYNPNWIPFNYFNDHGELVGFDVQMALDLAYYLGVKKVDFIPVEYDRLAEALDNRLCDIIMAGVAVTPERMRQVKYSAPYLTPTYAFIVPDYRVYEFQSVAKVARTPGLKIAALKGTANLATIQAYFPMAQVVMLDRLGDFFTNPKVAAPPADALLSTLEEGIAWTMMYPLYGVAEFKDSDQERYVYAYPMAQDTDDTFRNFVDTWLKMEDGFGGIQSKFDYWIKLENDESKPTRWSIIRDVLHWVP